MNKAQEALSMCDGLYLQNEFVSVRQTLRDITDGVWESDPAGMFDRLADMVRSGDETAKRLAEEVIQFIGGINPADLEKTGKLG